MIYQPLTHPRWGGALFLHRPFCHLQTGERWLHRFACAKLWLKKKSCQAALPSCCPLRVDVTWRAPRLKIEAKRRGERRNVVAVPTAGVSQVAQKTRCIVENSVRRHCGVSQDFRKQKNMDYFLLTCPFSQGLSSLSLHGSSSESSIKIPSGKTSSQTYSNCDTLGPLCGTKTIDVLATSQPPAPMMCNPTHWILRTPQVWHNDVCMCEWTLLRHTPPNPSPTGDRHLKRATMSNITTPWLIMNRAPNMIR